MIILQVDGAQCSASPLEPLVSSSSFDFYHSSNGGWAEAMTTDGSKYYICTFYGHVYAINIDGSLAWANDYSERCFTIYYSASPKYLLSG